MAGQFVMPWGPLSGDYNMNGNDSQPSGGQDGSLEVLKVIQSVVVKAPNILRAICKQIADLQLGTPTSPLTFFGSLPLFNLRAGRVVVKCGRLTTPCLFGSQK